VLLADLLDSIQEIEDFREILFTESDAILFFNSYYVKWVKTYRGMNFLRSSSGKSALDLCTVSAW